MDARTSRPFRIVVVGGGISGLATARRLAEQVDPAAIVLLEGSDRFGGKIAAVELDGVRLDAGAEAVLARRPEATALLAELGLAAVHPTAARPGLLIDGRRVELPPSRQGIPTDLDALAPVLSAAGLARARAEVDRPAPPLDGDVAIGTYAAERFGPEVTDRLLEPLLGGVYAGRSRELSFAAVQRPLFDRVRAGGSLLRHAQDPGPGSVPTGPVFAGLVGGVHGLVQALVDDLRARGVELRTRATVRELRPLEDGYELVVGDTRTAERLRADGVVLSTPAPATGRLLDGVAATASAWGAIPYASMAVVTTVLRGVDPDGSGLLVPPGGLPTVKAATFSSAKWAWVGDTATDRWGDDARIVRFSVGRRGEEALLQVDDETLLARTLAEVRAGLPGWSGARLVTGRVSRWGGGLPQYLVGHRDLVARLRSDLVGRPGLAVAGAALDGLGIAPCLATAELAATKIISDFAGPFGRMDG